MKKYHMIKEELAVTDQQELVGILSENKFVTLALCKDNIPYAVTLSYGYDSAREVLYMHCANKGKKLDFIRGNPRVCATIITDKGYEDGKCNHGYASVVIDGTIRELNMVEAKHALITMTGHLESAPQERQGRLPHMDEVIEKIVVLELSVDEISGRRSRIK